MTPPISPTCEIAPGRPVNRSPIGWLSVTPTTNRRPQRRMGDFTMRVAAIILVLGVLASCNADFKPEAAATTSAPASTLPAATQPTEPPPVITAAPPPAKRQTADPTSTTVPAPSGCGLAGAVFCETFDAPAGDGGKTGRSEPGVVGRVPHR